MLKRSETYPFAILIVLFCVAFCALNSGYAQSGSDSLVTAFEAEKDWNTKAKLAYQFTVANLGRDPETCLDLYSQVEAHLDAVTDSTQVFHLYNAKGIIYQHRGTLDTARTYFDLALNQAAALGDSSLMIRIMGNLAINYRHTGNFEKAIEYYQTAMKHYQANEDSINVGNMKAEIGNLHYTLKNWAEGYRYQREALQLFQAYDFWRGVGNVSIALAVGFEMQNQMDSAIAYSEQAVVAHDQSGDVFGQANAQRALCGYYWHHGRSEQEKIDCHLDLLELDRENGNKEGIMLDYLNIGIGNSNLRRHRQGEKYIQKALELARDLNDNRIRLDCYAALAQNYSDLNDFKRAYAYQDSAYVLQDSVRGMEVQNKILDLDKKYQTAEKERALAEEQSKSIILEKEKAEAELAVSNRNKWIFGLLGSALALLFLGLFLLQRNKRVARAEKDAALLRERDRGLKAVIDAQENERKRISKDLHDGIGQQLSGLKMAWEKLNTQLRQKAPEEKQVLTQLTVVLDEAAEEVRSISHQMMPKSLQNLGLVPALEDMLEKTFQHTAIKYSLEHHRAEQRYSEHIEISLYRICQELVNNCIKHSGASMMTVQLIGSKKHLTLLVEDNGTGMKPKASDGHGLMNIASRLRTVNGRVTYEPSPVSGTLATIRIPLDHA